MASSCQPQSGVLCMQHTYTTSCTITTLSHVQLLCYCVEGRPFSVKACLPKALHPVVAYTGALGIQWKQKHTRLWVTYIWNYTYTHTHDTYQGKALNHATSGVQLLSHTVYYSLVWSLYRTTADHGVRKYLTFDGTLCIRCGYVSMRSEHGHTLYSSSTYMALLQQTSYVHVSELPVKHYKASLWSRYKVSLWRNI